MENLDLNDMASLLLDSPGRSGTSSLETELERGLIEDYRSSNLHTKLKRAPSRSSQRGKNKGTSHVFQTEVEVLEARVKQVMKSGRIDLQLRYESDPTFLSCRMEARTRRTNEHETN